MNQPTARWTTLLATVALVALPAFTFAQDPSAPAPQSSTPAPSAQPTPQAPAAQSSNMDAAKTHLTTARNTLSELTQLPAAGQLQGEMRTQVAQLINNFNELITTQSDWKASYAKVEANLESLLATPAAAAADDPNRPTGTAGAVGTSGTKTAGLDPTIRAKLVKLRGELDEFEKAAGGPETAATPAPSAAPAATPPAATPPSTTPSSTTATTTSSTTTTTSTAPAANQPPSSDTVTISGKEAIEHIDAIELMLNGNALTPEQMSQLKAHLTELRRLIEKQ
jgi:hypothetical protein